MRPRSLLAASAVALVAWHIPSAAPAPAVTLPLKVSAPMSRPEPRPLGAPDAHREVAAGRLVWDNTGKWYAAASQPKPKTSVPGSRVVIRDSRPAPAPVAFDAGSIQELICSTFGDQCQRAVNVARCESGFDPSAINPHNHHVRGVFQIHDSHAAAWLEVIGKPYEESWMNAGDNIAFARWLYDQSGGWGPWACRG